MFSCLTQKKNKLWMMFTVSNHFDKCHFHSLILVFQNHPLSSYIPSFFSSFLLHFSSSTFQPNLHLFSHSLIPFYITSSKLFLTLFSRTTIPVFLEFHSWTLHGSHTVKLHLLKTSTSLIITALISL